MELAKSHHFVVSLTVLRPISSSHELSCFNKKANSKRIWSCRVYISKLDINTQPAQSKKIAQQSHLITFFQPTATCCYHQMCRLSCFKMAANKTQKLQNLNCKIDCDVYCCSFEVMCDFQLPIIPTGSPFCRKFGTSHDFLPISHHFSQLQVQESHIFSILPFGGWQVWVIVMNFSENDKMDTYTYLVFLIGDYSVKV